MLVWQAHKGKIESMAFAPDGRFLATATGGTRTVYLWEPTTGKLARKLTGDWPDGHRGLGAVLSVAFAPDAPLLAAGTYRSVTLWRTDTWELASDLDTGCAHELAFGPGEAPMLAASEARDTTIWDDAGRPTGDGVRPFDRRCGPHGGVAVLDFTSDGKLLAASNCHAAGLWDPVTAGLDQPLERPPGNHRGAVRFSPDGSVLALARGKYVDLWEVAGGIKPAATIVAGTGRQPAVWALGWTAAGKVLMTAGADGFVRLWDAAAGKELRSFEWGIGKVYCAAFSPDGLTCAAGGEKGQVVVWDVDE
jgi:WD40 repeat protein